MLTTLLFLLCAPLGIRRLWRNGSNRWLLGLYALFGLPLFVLLYGLAAIVGFAAFLPPLDLGVSDRLARTVRYEQGNFESTFLESAHDTNGAHELIRVRVQPKGGNSPHYHRQFEETFTSVEGQIVVHLGERSIVLNPGDSVTAPRGTVHWFQNETQQTAIMTIRVAPARGLEKTIRVAYGLDGTGKWSQGTRTRNFWRIVLLLGYSESYLPDIPPLVQEPLVNAFARIAQWTGQDEELKVFFE